MPQLQESENRPPGLLPPEGEELDRILRAALFEDRGSGDLTTEVAISAKRMAKGQLLAKGSGILAGGSIFQRVFALENSQVTCTQLVQDGAEIKPGMLLFELHGCARALLVAERTALNFLQRLSGIASLTKRFVSLAAGDAEILDTRKTTPGLRALEKYAVRCGGGVNHRFGLFDEVMVKDNHIDASGLSLKDLLLELRSAHGLSVRITAEARNQDEAMQALAGDADVILLDNMTPGQLRVQCPILRKTQSQFDKRTRRVLLEASGGINLSNVAEFAKTGVDRISVGALTHSAPALDLSLALKILP